MLVKILLNNSLVVLVLPIIMAVNIFNNYHPWFGFSNIKWKILDVCLKILIGIYLFFVVLITFILIGSK